LADEPTANLDHHTANEVLDVICHLNREDKVAILFSSHDPKILQRAHRVFFLVDGEEEKVSLPGIAA
jgi:putative ABC transport system ATP-binding protein